MSLDFIPVEIYTSLYYFIILFVTLFICVELHIKGYKESSFGFLLLLFILVYMGLRPISGVFTDMVNYSEQFNNAQNRYIDIQSKDVGFDFFMLFSSKMMNVNSFFFLCAFLYIYTLYLVCKKWFTEYWFYAFILLVGSFSFWAYGTNGIRNGIAGSLFLLGISRDKRVWQIVLIFIAINFHKSILLPTLGFIIAQFFNKPKIMIGFWLLCIPLSLAAGGFWETFFAGLGFEDERLSYLTQGNVNDDDFSSTGFRWDFILYSATAVFAGWYFIVKKGFKDKIYYWVFNTYVFANAFWILVIRANFSNRFAYLSWFMMALVIVYPFLKENSMKIQPRVLAWVILLYFSFTFFMNVVIAK